MNRTVFRPVRDLDYIRRRCKFPPMVDPCPVKQCTIVLGNLSYTQSNQATCKPKMGQSCLASMFANVSTNHFKTNPMVCKKSCLATADDRRAERKFKITVLPPLPLRRAPNRFRMCCHPISHVACRTFLRLESLPICVAAHPKGGTLKISRWTTALPVSLS